MNPVYFRHARINGDLALTWQCSASSNLYFRTFNTFIAEIIIPGTALGLLWITENL